MNPVKVVYLNSVEIFDDETNYFDWTSIYFHTFDVDFRRMTTYDDDHFMVVL